jgi:multidrug efflux pump subunit AcrA (membrane-fusion protein)
LKGGEVLFRILDTDRVYVSAIVPEAEYRKARSLSGAEIEIPGDTRPRPAGRLVSVGKIVDAASRTFPIVYEFPNSDGRIAINQTVTIRLFLGGSRRGVMIPETALVDDGGRSVVFIQRSGEKFVRKPVDVGYRQSGMAEITSGVETGDRIVIQGAYLIRLSTLSPQIPAHGHVH